MQEPICQDTIHMEELDEYDNKILNILVKEARLSYSQIGERVGLSRVSVKNRMEILEEKGIIRGYVAVINPTAAPEGRRFFMEGSTEPGKFQEVVERIARYDIIRRMYAITGECRFRAEGFASTNSKYEVFLRNVRRQLDGVKSLVVQDVQYTIKDTDGGCYGEERRLLQDQGPVRSDS